MTNYKKASFISILFINIVLIFFITFNIVSNNKIVLKNVNFGFGEFKVSLPDNLTFKKLNTSEIKFVDNKENTGGGISIFGNYQDMTIYQLRPTHSTLIKSEPISTPLGKGNLYVLERSYSVALHNPILWKEVHVIIPINKEFIYDIWLVVEKDIEQTKKFIETLIQK